MIALLTRNFPVIKYGWVVNYCIMEGGQSLRIQDS